MDSVAGCCLRLVSLCLWGLLIVVGTCALPALVLGVGVANRQAGSTFLVLCVSYLCTLIPTCLEWAMCQQTFEWGSLDWIVSKQWHRLPRPFWRALVFAKSWPRFLLKFAHCAVASLCGAVYVSTLCSLSSSVPFWLLFTFGFIHAAVYNYRGGDRVVYPAIHLSRGRRMQDAMYPAFVDSLSGVWIRAAGLSLVINFLAPTPFASFSDYISVVVPSMMYCFSLAASGKLVHILLSERLIPKARNDLDHSVVRSFLIVLHGLSACIFHVGSH